MAKRGRPAYQRDDKTAAEVERMSGYGLPQDAIAHIIGIGESTLQVYYAKELKEGAPKANSKVVQHLHKLATEDKNPTAAIFWLKCRAQWKDHQVIEHVGKDGKELVPSISVTIRKAGS